MSSRAYDLRPATCHLRSENDQQERMHSSFAASVKRICMIGASMSAGLIIGRWADTVE